MINNSFKEHFRLYFNFEFTYKNYLALKVISDLMNEMFKPFSSRYEYIKWRRNIFGGYHLCHLNTKNKSIIFYIDLVSVSDNLLKHDYIWYKELLKLIFSQDSFRLDETAFENEKNKLMMGLKERESNSSFISTNRLLKAALDEDNFKNVYPLDYKTIKELKIKDVFDVFVSLKDHLFHTSSFNMPSSRYEEILSNIPHYEEKKLSFYYKNIKNENILISEKIKNVSNNSYSLLYKINSEKHPYNMDIVYYYLRHSKSIFFNVIREQYGLIYAYDVYCNAHDNYFVLNMNIKETKKELVKEIISDFINNPHKYISENDFKLIKAEYLNFQRSFAKSKEYVYGYNDENFYEPARINFKEYIRKLSKTSYKQFQVMIKTIAYAGECFIKGEARWKRY